MNATSNFVELAVAVAISLFGLQSNAALTMVMGVLVGYRLPVLVNIANTTHGHFSTVQKTVTAKEMVVVFIAIEHEEHGT